MKEMTWKRLDNDEILWLNEKEIEEGAISEIFSHMKQLTKKALIKNISMRLLGLEFKSDTVIKSKAMRYIVKNYLRL